MAVIDFHSHILPGIDDGSKSADMSAEMLHMAGSQGVDVMIATPHFYASRQSVDTFLERRNRAFESLKSRMKDLEKPPQVLPGAEVAFFPGISGAERVDDLAVAGTKVLLLEMPFVSWSDRDIHEVEELVMARHCKVILVHLERYMKISGNRRKIEALFHMPLYVQINAESLLNWLGRRPLIKMFENSQAHFLGSDCHGIDKRKPNLFYGRQVLEKKLGKDFLYKMDERGSRLLRLEGE